MEIFKRWEGKIKIEVVDWTYPGVLAPVPENLMNETGVRHYLGRQHKYVFAFLFFGLLLLLHHFAVLLLTSTFRYHLLNKPRRPSEPPKVLRRLLENVQAENGLEIVAHPGTWRGWQTYICSLMGFAAPSC